MDILGSCKHPRTGMDGSTEHSYMMNLWRLFSFNRFC